MTKYEKRALEISLLGVAAEAVQTAIEQECKDIVWDAETNEYIYQWNEDDEKTQVALQLIETLEKMFEKMI